ncbi:MAG TPA: NUDIX domain-containing protein [Caulobacterales bacterium]|jgi:ADP-ribose pyrophosphatase YjhB (NUDIX family)|nr:NUDIX domain-containing protein [Caulobacterales bacterium]
MARRIPVPVVWVSCFRGADALLIRRGKPPMRDVWAPPGGRLRWGETLTEAALRQLREKAGVEGELIGVIDAIDQIVDGALQSHFAVICFAARWTAGVPRGASETTEARFFTPQDLAQTRLTRTIARLTAEAAARIPA